MRSSAFLASSPSSIVTAVQRRPVSLRAIAVNTCVPIRFSGLRIVTGTSMLASNTSPPPSGRRLMRVASHVKLLRRAADVDRDRFERELRVARGLGGGGLLGLGRLGGVLCGGGGVELRLRVGLGGVELRPRLRGLGGGLLLPLLGPRLGLVRLCGGERLVGGRELGVGAPLEQFQLAQRRRERCRLARRCRGGLLRLVGRLGGLRGLAGERLGARRSSRDGLRVRHAIAPGGKTRPGPRRSAR